MKNAVVVLGILFLFAAAAAGQYMTNSVDLSAANPNDGRWDDFDWDWSGYDDLVIFVTNSYDYTSGSLLYRMSFPKRGTSYLDVTNFTEGATTSILDAAIDYTNKPPDRPYYSEFIFQWVDDGGQTRQRTIAQGRHQTMWSLYQGTNSANYTNPATPIYALPAYTLTGDVTTVTMAGGSNNLQLASGSVTATEIAADAVGTNEINTTQVDSRYDPGAVWLVTEAGTATRYPPAADTDAARGDAFELAEAAAVDGDRILLGPGTYELSAAMTITADVAVVGSGPGEYQADAIFAPVGGSIIEWTGAADAITIDKSETTGVLLQNLGIAYNGSGTRSRWERPGTISAG